MIEIALCEFLLSQTAVTDIVGNKIVPQVHFGTQPAITYTRTATGRGYRTPEGNTTEATAFLTITCWGGPERGGYTRAKELANAVRYALDGYRGQVSGHWIDSIMIEDESDAFAEVGEENTIVHGIEIEIEIAFREPAPNRTNP